MAFFNNGFNSTYSDSPCSVIANEGYPPLIDYDYGAQYPVATQFSTSSTTSSIPVINENLKNPMEDLEEFCEFFQNFPDPNPAPLNQFPVYGQSYDYQYQQPMNQQYYQPNFAISDHAHFDISPGFEKQQEAVGNYYGSSSQSSDVGKIGKKRIPAIHCHQNSVCSNCKTRKTTLWRRNSNGGVECNACNLYFRKNNRKRPLSLKKDEIVKRKRNPRN